MLAFRRTFGGEIIHGEFTRFWRSKFTIPKKRACTKDGGGDYQSMVFTFHCTLVSLGQTNKYYEEVNSILFPLFVFSVVTKKSRFTRVNPVRVFLDGEKMIIQNDWGNWDYLR